MPLDLTIVTPSGRAYRGDVDSVVLPGSEGDFGVLPGHERFLTALRVGEIQIRAGNQTLVATCGEGFADVSAEQVAVMVDACEFAGSRPNASSH
jgi:F-type H+-transporting ATPase subunit epsilon